MLCLEECYYNPTPLCKPLLLAFGILAMLLAFMPVRLHISKGVLWNSMLHSVWLSECVSTKHHFLSRCHGVSSNMAGLVT